MGGRRVCPGAGGVAISAVCLLCFALAARSHQEPGHPEPGSGSAAASGASVRIHSSTGRVSRPGRRSHRRVSRPPRVWLSHGTPHESAAWVDAAGGGYAGYPLAGLPVDYVQRHLELLPDPGQLQRAPAATPDPDAAAAQEALRSLVGNCSSSGGGMWTWTYGATGALLGSLLKPLALSLDEGRGFHTPQVDDLCGRRDTPADLSCIGLEPLSRCGRPTSAAAVLERAPDISARTGALVPERYAARGLFWWTAQALGRLTGLTPGAAARLEGLRRRWAWAQHRPVLGVHIRQGDTCHRGFGRVIKARRCDHPSAYLEAMLPLIRRYGVRGVFVASDSDDAIAFVRSRLAEDGVPVFSNDGAVDRQATYGRFNNFDKAIASGTIDMVADRAAVVTEMHLLAEADLLLGKHTSNMMRHALALGTFKRGGAHIVPFRSLDATWCADYERFSGNSTVGARSFKC